MMRARPGSAPAHPGGLVSFVALLALTGCASSNSALTEVWHNEAYEGPVKRALVIVMVRAEHERRELEKSIAHELEHRGVEAVEGIDVLAHEEQVERGNVKAAVEGQNVDVCVITRLVSTEEEKDVSRGSTYDSAMPHENLYGYYFWATSALPTDHSYSTDAHVETSVYEVASQKLIWTATSEPFAPPTTADSMIKQETSALVASLADLGWLPSR